MASAIQPLGIGLTVDFARLDADLNEVANRIEKVGSETSLKIGTLAGAAATGDLGGDKLAAQVANVGIELSRGMASGIRASTALLLGFGARITAILDRVAGVTIALFTRIDAAMRFPRFDSFMARLSTTFRNIWKGAKSDSKVLDTALAGGFGKIAKVIAQVFQALFNKLAKDMAASFGAAAEKMGESMKGAGGAIDEGMNKKLLESDSRIKKLVGGIGRVVGAMKKLVDQMGKFSAATNKAQVDVDKLAREAHLAAMTPTSLPAPKAAAAPRVRVPDKGLETAKPFKPRGSKAEAPPTTRPPYESAFLPLEPIPMPKKRPAAAPAAPKAADAAAAKIRDMLGLVKRLDAATVALPVAPFVAIGRGIGGIAFMAQDATNRVKKLGGEGVKSFSDMNKQVQKSGGYIKALGHTMGGLGQVLALPLGAGYKMVQVATMIGAGFADMAVRSVRGVNATINLMTSLGSVGKKTYTDLVNSQSIWVRALMALPIRVPIWGLQQILKVAQYVPNVFTMIGNAASSALGLISPKAAAAAGALGNAAGRASSSWLSLVFQWQNMPIGLVVAGVKMLGGLFAKVFGGGKQSVDGMSKSTGVLAKTVGAVKGNMDVLGSTVTKTGQSFMNLGRQILAAFGVIGLVMTVVRFFKQGVAAATDLNATVGRSKTIFGDAFGPVEAQADKLTKTYHVSKAAQLDLAASFGGMAAGAGMAERKSADLANQLTKAAVNMTGEGIAFEEISEQIKTGLGGRAMQLKQHAVLIDENTVKAFAWSQGIARAGSELNNQQTLAARAGLILRGLAHAEGMLDKNAAGAGAQFRMAGGGVALFAEKMGTMLLPLISTVTAAFNSLLGVVLDAFDRFGPSLEVGVSDMTDTFSTFVADIVAFGPAIVEGVKGAWEEAKQGPLGFVAEAAESFYHLVNDIPKGLGIMVRHMGDIWEIAKLQAGAFVDNTIAFFRVLPENVGIVFTWLFKNWRTIFVDMLAITYHFVNNVATNMKNLASAIIGFFKGEGFNFEWTPLLKGFEATTEKLPELIKPGMTDVSKEVGKIWEKITTEEMGRKIKKAGAPPPVGKRPEAAPEVQKEKEMKLGGALEVGSKEAFSAISKGMTGRQDVGKSQLGVQKQIEKNTKDMGLAMKAQAAKFDARVVLKPK